MTKGIDKDTEEGEMDPSATVKQYLTVQTKGTRKVGRAFDHYNLDLTLAVGYRRRSPRGIQFRRWTTERQRESLVKGFVMDDERLKPGPGFGPDYFDELLARIRDIWASEKRFCRITRRLREGGEAAWAFEQSQVVEQQS